MVQLLASVTLQGKQAAMDTAAENSGGQFDVGAKRTAHRDGSEVKGQMRWKWSSAVAFSRYLQVVVYSQCVGISFRSRSRQPDLLIYFSVN